MCVLCSVEGNEIQEILSILCSVQGCRSSNGSGISEWQEISESLIKEMVIEIFLHSSKHLQRFANNFF